MIGIPGTISISPVVFLCRLLGFLGGDSSLSWSRWRLKMEEKIALEVGERRERRDFEGGEAVELVEETVIREEFCDATAGYLAGSVRLYARPRSRLAFLVVFSALREIFSDFGRLRRAAETRSLRWVFLGGAVVGGTVGGLGKSILRGEGEAGGGE